MNRPPVGSLILKHIITQTRTPFTSDSPTHTPISPPIHIIMVVIIVTTALILTVITVIGGSKRLVVWNFPYLYAFEMEISGLF